MDEAGCSDILVLMVLINFLTRRVVPSLIGGGWIANVAVIMHASRIEDVCIYGIWKSNLNTYDSVMAKNLFNVKIIGEKCRSQVTYWQFHFILTLRRSKLFATGYIIMNYNKATFLMNSFWTKMAGSGFTIWLFR